MKKIYFVIAGAFLILLIIISILLSLGKKTTTTTQDNAPFPTDVPLPGSTQQIGQDQQSTGIEDLVQETGINNDISTISPVETEDFKLQYSSKLNQIVVERKTDQAEVQFENWAYQNERPQLVDDPDLVLMVDYGKNPDDFNPLIEFLNIFMNMGQGSEQSNNGTIDQSTSPTSSFQSPTTTSFTYYAQCGDQGNTPLPDGDTLCHAGCGPTTVAMISSSYVDKKYDPKTIVDLYDKNNYLLGGSGSRYSDAHELLKSFGLKTTDYLVFNSEKSDTVVPQLRKYLNAGWTFFTLASFCEKGCGHYFWITDIDDQGNIFAYDPAYGRYQIPYNENSRYPYPLYRLAFGVKR
ncbi:MAG: C39 family peptidase [Candidatus Roizmanbacteria bacterium]|nr:C39 family peptidase [Candidatus Roizmanbacteria bacterium]MCR4312627.1 C39 family peptidase [Candidatus Roizmanbacteria bacterium]